MTRELVENALTNIDDQYIDEAINYKKENNVISFPRVPKKMVKAATITFAILVVGSATAYATTSFLRKVLSTNHSVYVGSSEDMEDESFLDADDTVNVEDKGTITGDDSVNWITKHEENVNGESDNTYYTYDSYEKAVNDAGLDNWFPEIKGEMKSVQYIFQDMQASTTKSINAEYAYGNGTYFIVQEMMEGNVAEDMTYILPVLEKSNEREYTNAAGQTFTLVDNKEDVSKFNEEKGKMENVQATITYAMISYNRYYGYIEFEGLTEDEIHEILENIVIKGE